MKKFLVAIAFSIATFANGQDFQFIDQIKALPNQEKAIEIATEMASTSTSKLRLYKAKASEKSNMLEVVFVPSEISDQAIESYNVSDSDKTKFLTVIFAIDKGSSLNYRLLELQTNYKNMFPIWKRYFKSDANEQITLSDYKSQHLKDISKKIDFYIQNREALWILINQS